MTKTLSKSHAVDRRQLLKASAISAAGAAAGMLASPYVARAAQRYTIAFLPKSLSIPVFFFGHYGADKRAKELGDVDIIWTGPTSEDANKQAQIISELTSRHVDAIAISAVAQEPLIRPINAAIDQGIIVTGWDLRRAEQQAPAVLWRRQLQDGPDARPRVGQTHRHERQGRAGKRQPRRNRPEHPYSRAPTSFSSNTPALRRKGRSSTRTTCSRRSN